MYGGMSPGFGPGALGGGFGPGGVNPGGFASPNIGGIGQEVAASPYGGFPTGDGPPPGMNNYGYGQGGKSPAQVMADANALVNLAETQQEGKTGFGDILSYVGRGFLAALEFMTGDLLSAYTIGESIVADVKGGKGEVQAANDALIAAGWSQADIDQAMVFMGSDTGPAGSENTAAANIQFDAQGNPSIQADSSGGTIGQDVANYVNQAGGTPAGPGDITQTGQGYTIDPDTGEFNFTSYEDALMYTINQNAEMAKDVWNFYTETERPILEQYYQEATAKPDYRGAMDRASAGVATSFDASKDAVIRELTRMGVSPDSKKMADILTQLKSGEAKATAGARTGAMLTEEEKYRKRLSEAAGFASGSSTSSSGLGAGLTGQVGAGAGTGLAFQSQKYTTDVNKPYEPSLTDFWLANLAGSFGESNWSDWDKLFKKL